MTTTVRNTTLNEDERAAEYKRRDLPFDVLSKLLRYDPETGVMFWLPRIRELFPSDWSWTVWNKRYAGEEAFTAVDGKGYRHGTIYGRQYRAHRVAWVLAHGDVEIEDIDHINGIRTDNRIVNLRAVSRAENLRNQRLKPSNTSGVTGVHWCKKSHKWIAQIVADGNATYLGAFNVKADAIAAREAANRLYGFHENHGKAA